MALDAATIADSVRYWIGEPSTDTITDTTLQYIAQRNIDSIGDDDSYECEVTYASILETLQYLIRAAMVDTAEEGGETSKRKEVRGKTTIEVEYDTDGDDAEDIWQNLYDMYLMHPEWICDDLVDSSRDGRVLFGGTSQTEYNRVNNRSDSRNGYQLNVGLNYKTKRIRGSGRRGYWTI